MAIPNTYEDEDKLKALPSKSTFTKPEKQDAYIYTSIRYDPILVDSPENTAASFHIACPFYMLEHHYTRLQVANWANGLPPAIDGRPANFLHGLLYAVKQWQLSHPKEAEWAEALRIRRRAYPNGRITTEIWQIPRKPITSLFPKSLQVPSDALTDLEWTTTIDNTPTEVTEATMFKTWDRSPHGRARVDAGILNLGAKKEVLLYNSDDEIFDGSNSTPYFWRNGGWVTPISSSGGLQGATRRWALEQHFCTEALVVRDSLTDGEVVWFSNAVNGFFFAIYHPRSECLRPSTNGEHDYVIRQLC